MTLFECFAQQASRTPDATAIVAGQQTLSYRELLAQARELADELADAGVRPGSLVGLRMPRCAGVAVGILGILACGCGYVPVDPGYPEERQRLITEDARLGAVVTWPGDQERPSVRAVAPAGEPHQVPPGVAYVIYTSGSTGIPKGVVVGQRHVLALMDSCQEIYGFGPDDVWSLYHSYGFDFSVWELWGALLYGGAAVVVPQQTVADPRSFARFLAYEGITVLNQVPTVFGYLLAELEARPRQLPALRHVILGGEPVSMPAVCRWQEMGWAPRASLANMYGITETTVHVTHCPLTGPGTPAWPGTTPIGTPLAHLDVQIVDEALRAVPPGTPGEMVVSGDSVSHGYLGRDDLTGDRFADLAGRRAFRTGDWGIRDEAGQLHYIGRQDRQVQLRGFRVELGEPEAAIAQHPGVAQCVVTVLPSRRGEPMLAAHYVPRPGMAVSAAQLREFLQSRMPPQMIPGIFHSRAEIPVTGHGKADVPALNAALRSRR